MGFLRHFTPELLSIKKSATFAHSTFRIIIPSVGFIPSPVAPQQSLCPFIPTSKSTEKFHDTVRFTLPNTGEGGITGFKRINFFRHQIKSFICLNLSLCYLNCSFRCLIHLVRHLTFFFS